MQDLNHIINVSSALLTPIVAIAGICIGIANYSLQKRKRKDELFDRRYKFLKEFDALYKTTGQEDRGAKRPYLEWDDIEPYAQEAEYLFGKDIANHLRKFEGKCHDQNFNWIVDSDLSKPFAKYLRF